ncbi:hypothetical protein [Streptomyces sp. PA03-2a]|uniref:hypothetical protein n=1 Tax=Streptomyces sp. PA03-2a TaxID=3028701 RepID=UPI0029A846CE|nr:hypothetical protein [Streptomyces sp. PA03-2a]MDX2732855.1 hypothetical protein [Streptomyces sp. PA03-2a]
MATQNLTGAPAASIAMSPADIAAHQAATYVRPAAVLLPMPERLVENFDNYGSYWGVDTITATEAMITEARADGQHVAEWNVTDRAGHSIRVVRVPDPDFLDTIAVIPAWNDERAVVRTQICRDEIDRLSAMDARTMTPADFDQLAQAQAELSQLSER